MVLIRSPSDTKALVYPSNTLDFVIDGLDGFALGLFCFFFGRPPSHPFYWRRGQYCWSCCIETLSRVISPRASGRTVPPTHSPPPNPPTMVPKISVILSALDKVPIASAAKQGRELFVCSLSLNTKVSVSDCVDI